MMTRTELPWTLLGRRIRPYALSVSLASASLAWIITARQSAWGDERDYWSLGVAALAVVSTALLWAGFWGRSERAMRAGLLTSAAVFTVRSMYVALSPGGTATAMLGFCFAIASGGAYLLEVTTGGVPRRPRVRRGEVRQLRTYRDREVA